MYRKSLLLIAIGILSLIVLVWMSHRNREQFIDLPAGMPEPRAIMKQMRDLLDKYDTPELWDHAASVAQKDPSELARSYIQSQKAADT